MRTPQDAFLDRFNDAVAHAERGELEKACEIYARCLSMDDDPKNLAMVLNNIYACLDTLGEDGFEELVFAGLELDPECPELWSAVGRMQSDRHNYKSAVLLYTAALTQKPYLHMTGFNLSLCCLLHGDMKAGWPLYELRWSV
jgi:tetratricopeptide (TPR) repeat protein